LAPADLQAVACFLSSFPALVTLGQQWSHQPPEFGQFL